MNFFVQGVIQYINQWNLGYSLNTYFINFFGIFCVIFVLNKEVTFISYQIEYKNMKYIQVSGSSKCNTRVHLKICPKFC